MTIDQSKRTMAKGLALASTPLARFAGARSMDTQTRIAFGSCLHQDKPQPVWEAVLATEPEAFIFLGDNIYGDSDDPAVLAEKYAQLALKPGFRRLRERCACLAIWDDHDYGENDAGLEYVGREASRTLMLDFWGEPAESERRSRPDGIYTSYVLGEEGQRVQVILLDLRWNRTPLKTVESEEAWLARDAVNMGPYSPSDDFSASLLGEQQWQWLEEQLNEPADVRIIASSIQLLADFTGWETWANFPHERERFLALIAEHQSCPLFIISGDVHWCEISRYDDPDTFSQPLVEVTSSGLTEVWEQISPNRHRVGEAVAAVNFGLITIDWLERGPRIALEVRGEDSRILQQYQLPE